MGFPNYQVDEEGNVWCRRRDASVAIGRGWRKMKPKTLKRGGHLYLSTLRGNDGIKGFLVHHLVLFALVGPRPDGMVARHLNGIPTDNRVSNLCWGTHQDNAADRVRHGVHNRGERNGKSKISDLQAVELKSMWASGKYTQEFLGKIFGLKQPTVSLIVHDRIRGGYCNGH